MILKTFWRNEVISPFPIPGKHKSNSVLLTHLFRITGKGPLQGPTLIYTWESENHKTLGKEGLGSWSIQ